MAHSEERNMDNIWDEIAQQTQRQKDQGQDVSEQTGSEGHGQDL